MHHPIDEAKTRESFLSRRSIRPRFPHARTLSLPVDRRASAAPCRPVRRTNARCCRRRRVRARRRAFRSRCSTRLARRPPDRDARAAPARGARRRAAHGPAAAASVGDTVGYRVRVDTRVGPQTRIEVVTEGVLTRMLQRDPTLEASGSSSSTSSTSAADADLGAGAHAPDAHVCSRDDLRVARHVRDARRRARSPAARRCADRDERRSQFPGGDALRRRRRDRRARRGRRRRAPCARARRDAGDVLVFLPGAGEIRRARASCSTSDAAATSTCSAARQPLRRASRTARSRPRRTAAQGRARDVDRRNEPHDRRRARRHRLRACRACRGSRRAPA